MAQQQVSVKDVNEIRTFASGVERFAGEYTDKLRSIASEVDSDQMQMRTIVDKLQVAAEQAQREYEAAVQAVEEAEERMAEAETESSARHWEGEARYRMRIADEKEAQMEAAKAKYEEAQDLQQEAERMLDEVRSLCETAQRDMEDTASNTVSVIKKAAENIEQYANS